MARLCFICERKRKTAYHYRVKKERGKNRSCAGTGNRHCKSNGTTALLTGNPQVPGGQPAAGMIMKLSENTPGHASALPSLWVPCPYFPSPPENASAKSASVWFCFSIRSSCALICSLQTPSCSSRIRIYWFCSLMSFVSGFSCFMPYPSMGLL